MEKQELYHFHKTGNYDRKWDINKIITVGEDFNSTTYKRFLEFNNSIKIDDTAILNFFIFAQAISDLKSGSGRIYSKKEMIDILELGYETSYYANEFKRESALENYRLKNHNNLPSRLHSVYLTDEKGIETWKQKFGNSDLVLYRVEAEGKIFKTNEELIPDERLNYEATYANAYKYWNPKFKNVSDDCNEYLAQGKIKVLEKIKRF